MTAGRPLLPPAPFLYAILDLALLRGRRTDDVAAALLRGGAALLQVRGKAVDDRTLLRAVRDAREAARAASVPLLVNDRADVARLANADGVHVGQDDLSPEDVRAVVGPSGLVGVSTHGLAQVRAAASWPVDYVAVGPVFATRTKDRPDPVVGTALVREAAAAVRQPIVAIGGITAANAGEVVAAGAHGLAVISAVLGDDPEGSARALVAALRGGMIGRP